MPIKVYKPYTPSRRYMTVVDYSVITKKRPEKSLVVAKKRSGGRNNLGRITVRHRGGGHRKLIRIVDFKRDKHGIPAKVESIEYDPNRTAFIALLKYADGEKRYIIAPDGLKVGDVVMSGPESEIKVGNHLPLSKIPEGMEVHNIELYPGKGGQMVRAAGTAAIILSKEDKYAYLQLPSGETRMVLQRCYATIGRVSNIDNENVIIGKAGRTRWLGRRPHVRGVVMNPCDHPLGGGEGRSKGGRPPVSPWGKPAKGGKTRKKGKWSDRLIVRRRRK